MFTGTRLTATEQHVLHALGTGASNKHVARNLGKSEYTVRSQLSLPFKKVNVSNRTQAACWHREYLNCKECEDVVGTSVPLQRQPDYARMPDQELRK